MKVEKDTNMDENTGTYKIRTDRLSYVAEKFEKLATR
jgi:hypothetical protein